MSETSNRLNSDGNSEISRDIATHDKSPRAPTPESEEAWYKTTAAKIGASVLLVAAGAAATFGMMLPKGEAVKTAPETSKTPVAAAPVIPGEASTGAPSEKLLTVASLELPANLTPEQLATTIMQDRLNQWVSSGQTEANRAAWLKTSLPESEFIRNTITDKIGDTYADALLVSNWRDIPELKNWVDFQKASNTASLALWFKTYKTGLSEDVEPYERGSTVDLTTVVPPETTDTVSITMDITRYDNASKNRALTLDRGVAVVNGDKYILDATLKLIDGNWKISALNSLAFSNSN